MSQRASFILIIAVTMLLAGPAAQAQSSSCTLADHIKSANTNTAIGNCPAGTGHDIITITEDITLSEALPPITGTITIEGNGHTIRGDNKFRIFDVVGGNLGIRNVTLAEGKVKERRYAEGGAIRLQTGARVTIENSTLARNSATVGGAIATVAWNVQLEIRGSSFVGNESEFGGGAIQVNGGTVYISSSSFNENYTRGDGGAIDALRGRLRVWNSTFSGNRGYLGGAIDVDGAEAILTHLTLAENSSKFGGDGLYSRSGLVYLRNSIIDSRGSRQKDCIGILEQHRGNLIADWSCSAPLGGSSLLSDIEGAPAYRPLRDGSPALDAADPEFCLETDQIGTARPHGDGCDIGAIESTTATPLSISVKSICNLSFQITAANQDRWIGACPPGNGADTIELTEDITLTEPLPSITSEIVIKGNGYTISGDNRFPIFDVDKGNLKIKDLILANGNAQNSGGGAIRLGYKAEVDATNVSFNSNTATFGGAIYVGLDSKLHVVHSRFHDNAASYEGGALHVKGPTEISHSVLSENSAVSGGGAILADYQTLHINNSTFVQNRADEGGALSVDSGKVTLTHVTMIANQGMNGGNSIHRRRRGWGEIHLRNSLIAGGASGPDCAGYLDRNVANHIEDGSCLPAHEGDPLVDESPGAFGLYVPKDASPLVNAADPGFCLETDQNGIPRPFGAACDIGAIEVASDFAASATPVPPVCSLHDRIVAANTDSAVGSCQAGAGHDTIYISEDISLHEVLPEITSAITVEGGEHNISGNNQFRIIEVRGGDLTINNLTMTNGYAAYDGGAIYLRSGGSVTVNNSAFIGNYAQWGGAIYMEGGKSTLSVTGSQFSLNQSLNSGGAAILYSGSATFDSTSFHFNRSTEYAGGALQISTLGGTTITNSTFIGNKAPVGGAISFSSWSDGTLRHVTMHNNTATEDGTGHAIIIGGRESRVRMHNSLITAVPHSGEACHGQLQESSGNFIEDGSCEPALDGRPRLTSTTSWPPYVSPGLGSRARDNADPDHCPETDQLGNPRPQGEGCDIGAIEAR